MGRTFGERSIEVCAEVDLGAFQLQRSSVTFREHLFSGNTSLEPLK